jgi:hypothetical protein
MTEVTLDATDFLRKLNIVGKQAESLTEKALNQQGDKLLELSREKVPLDEGTLRQSGNAQQTGPMEVSVGYGGAAAAYALYQHEGGDGRRVVRNYSEPGTGKKYLERPLLENKILWNKILEQVISKGF